MIIIARKFSLWMWTNMHDYLKKKTFKEHWSKYLVMITVGSIKHNNEKKAHSKSNLLL